MKIKSKNIEIDLTNFFKDKGKVEDYFLIEILDLIQNLSDDLKEVNDHIICMRELELQMKEMNNE